MLAQDGMAAHSAIRSGDPMVQERRRLGCSIWLLMLLKEWRDPSDVYVSAGASITAAALGRALGVGERQARRDLQRLRGAGLVELQNTGRGFRIRLLPPERLPEA